MSDVLRCFLHPGAVSGWQMTATGLGVALLRSSPLTSTSLNALHSNRVAIDTGILHAVLEAVQLSTEIGKMLEQPAGVHEHRASIECTDLFVQLLDSVTAGLAKAARVEGEPRHLLIDHRWLTTLDLMPALPAGDWLDLRGRHI